MNGKLYVSKEGSLNAEIDWKKVTLYDAENAQGVDIAGVMTDCFMSGLEEMRKANVGRLSKGIIEHIFELGQMYLSGRSYENISHGVRLTIKEALEKQETQDLWSAGELAVLNLWGNVATDDAIEGAMKEVASLVSALGGDHGKALSDAAFFDCGLGRALSSIGFEKVADAISKFNSYDLSRQAFDDRIRAILETPGAFRVEWQKGR